MGADYLYACDGKWWMYHGDTVKEEFKGECWTTLPDADPGDHRLAIEKYQLNYVTGSSSERGLANAPNRITYGGNSGYQAIHLARNFGAARIILLGYDFGGKGHWFGEHPQRLNSGHDFQLWLSTLGHLAGDLAAEGIEVINCSRETAITCFSRKSIAEININ